MSILNRVKINPVLSDFPKNVLEQSLCQALSLTEISLEPNNLQACHQMKKKAGVAVKFQCRKQKYRVLSNRKTLLNKNLELT